jgi:hypothetical protein
MCGDAETPEPSHVFDHRLRTAGQRIRRRGHAKRRVVPAGGVELDRIERQHAAAICRGIWGAGAVAVIGEDDELQTRACRRFRDVIGRAAAVRPIGVDVVHAAHR